MVYGFVFESILFSIFIIVCMMFLAYKKLVANDILLVGYAILRAELMTFDFASYLWFYVCSLYQDVKYLVLRLRLRLI